MNDRVFYQSGLGVGAIIDGTIGFEFYKTKFDGKDMRSVRIYPLDHKQEAGDRNEDNPLVKDGAFIELCFGSPKSVEVFIGVLNELKEIFKE